jgi:hypothetical protein
MCENNPDAGGAMEHAGLNDTLGATVVLKHWLSVRAHPFHPPQDKYEDTSSCFEFVCWLKKSTCIYLTYLSYQVDTQNADGSSPSLARNHARQLNYPPSIALGSAASAKAWTFPTQTVPLSGASRLWLLFSLRFALINSC